MNRGRSGATLNGSLTIKLADPQNCIIWYKSLGIISYIPRTLVQAFISSSLDYCNSLLYGLSRQNAAARILTRRGEHNYLPVLRQLHWLPVQGRVDFKLACFVFSSLSGKAPPYLSDDIYLVSEGPRRRLRSSTDRSCAVPRTHNTFWRQELCCCRATCLEQPPTTLVRRRNFLQQA